MRIDVDLESIANCAIKKQDENTSFATFLKAQEELGIDQIVACLAEELIPQISCTDCGNCCRNLRPIATYKAMSPFVSDEDYESFKYLQGFACKHLEESKCGDYFNRPQECRDYPYMDRPHFSQRTNEVFQNYEVCPIVYNIVEHLKIELKWS